MSKDRVFLHFPGNTTIHFFDFLHDDRGQHCATSRPGIGFQQGMKYPNFNVFTFISEMLQWISFTFCMAIEANTVQRLATVLLSWSTFS